jgi:hypothetical protein
MTHYLSDVLVSIIKSELEKHMFSNAKWWRNYNL